LLERSANISKTGGIASFPLWLSHTQVRIIPVGKQHTELCEKIATELSSKQIRADIDDREESVGKKIRESETEWIRYTLVVGDRELKSERFTVRDRNEKKQYKDVKLEELVNDIKSQTNNKPYLPLNLPRHLSNRPQIMV
jgi:threonyl-tRNA synthetase